MTFSAPSSSATSSTRSADPTASSAEATGSPSSARILSTRSGFAESFLASSATVAFAASSIGGGRLDRRAAFESSSDDALSFVIPRFVRSSEEEEEAARFGKAFFVVVSVASPSSRSSSSNPANRSGKPFAAVPFLNGFLPVPARAPSAAPTPRAPPGLPPPRPPRGCAARDGALEPSDRHWWFCATRARGGAHRARLACAPADDPPQREVAAAAAEMASRNAASVARRIVPRKTRGDVCAKEETPRSDRGRDFSEVSRTSGGPERRRPTHNISRVRFRTRRVRFPERGREGKGATGERDERRWTGCDARDRLPSRVTTNPGKECV